MKGEKSAKIFPLSAGKNGFSESNMSKKNTYKNSIFFWNLVLKHKMIKYITQSKDVIHKV